MTVNAQTQQFVDNTINGTPLREIWITTVEAANTDDLSITTLLIEWKHGIFNTNESARITLVSSAYGTDHLIHEDGRIEEFWPTNEGASTLQDAISMHISETV